MSRRRYLTASRRIVSLTIKGGLCTILASTSGEMARIVTCKIHTTMSDTIVYVMASGIAVIGIVTLAYGLLRKHEL